MKKQRTGQKTGKNPPKKLFFSSPSDQLAEFGQIYKYQKYKSVELGDQLVVNAQYPTKITSIFYGLATQRLNFKKKLMRNSHFSRPAETGPYMLILHASASPCRKVRAKNIWYWYVCTKTTLHLLFFIPFPDFSLWPGLLHLTTSRVFAAFGSWTSVHVGPEWYRLTCCDPGVWGGLKSWT